MKSDRIKILLIIPDGNIHKIIVGSFARSMREAPLTLTTLAALIPNEIKCSVKIVDENVEKIPLDYQADIVGISVMTGTAMRAYKLADHFSRKKSIVVLGGIHVALRPEEALQHADVIIEGYAELTWPEFLRDYVKGKYRTHYKNTDIEEYDSFKNIPIPKRNLQRALRYNLPNTVTATRGCMGKCDFCSVPTVTTRYKMRPIEAVLKDIKSIKGRNFAFNDVSLVDNTSYAKELFNAMIPLKKRWGGLVTIRAAADIELIRMMKESGCSYVLIGLESVNQSALKEINKNFNKHDEYKKYIEIFHSYKISVQGCFMFGFDHDDKTVFDATVQRVNELKIDIPRYSILTPYPGTKLYKKLEKENRILTYNWEYYDTQHAVFKPMQMSADELYKGFCQAYKDTFLNKYILKRVISSPHPLINFLGNLAYRRYSGRLRRNFQEKNVPEILEL